MPKTSLHIGDVYALQERETGKWFTFQIIQIGEEWAVHIDLDYWSEKMPEEEDLKKMSYLRLNHHFLDNDITYCWAQIKYFPSHAKLIGNMVVQPLEECRGYGPWTNGCQQKMTEKWNQLPKEQVAAYKEAATVPRQTVIVGGEKVPNSLYGLTDDTLNLVTDYSEFDKLPVLTRIVTAQEHPHLIPFLERRYVIRELVWENCGREELDLSRTYLEELEISGANLRTIYLPQSMKRVTLRGKLSPDLRILSPRDGYFLALQIEMQDDFLPDVGLSRLTELRLSNIQEFSLQGIPSRFPGLLWLGLEGKPGIIHDIDEIAKLHELEKLTMDDLFGFSRDEFPLPDSLPQLLILRLNSIPVDVGKKVRKLYRDKVQELIVLKLRSDEWLHENLNNPLRHWDGSEFVPKSKYTKAVELWKDTRSRILEEAKRPDVAISDVKGIAIDYVEGFNKLDRRSQFIETEEREDIMKAFEQIIDEAGLFEHRQEIIDVIDEKRNW